MRKLYEALSVDVVKFEAQDVITVSNGANDDGYDGDKEQIPEEIPGDIPAEL